MTLADLQSNISISAQNAVTGDIEFCTGYTGFSDDIGEQAGWYLALKVSTSAEGSALEGATITATYAGTVRTLEDGETFIIRLAEGEDSITFTANKEGYTEGRLTLDISGLDKEALTQNILYTASLTNGVTVSPLQFGESKTITGQVPWNTTDNANTFNISMRPFEMVAPGTPWSIAFDGVEIAEGEFSTITPAGGKPSYSFAGAKLPITQEMISDQSPYLVVTVRSYGPDPMGSFYSSMNIGALTLAPDPRPKVNITSDTQGITISPSTYATSKTATGEAPYDVATRKNVLGVALTTSGTIPAGPYTIEVFAQGDVMQQPIWYVAGASTIPQTIPIPLTSNEVGTGKYITVNISGANDPEFNIITIDTSALTLESGTGPYVQFSDITYNNVNYQVSDFITGGIISRDYATNVNAITISGAYFKRVSLDGGVTHGYYLPLKSYASDTKLFYFSGSQYPDDLAPIIGCEGNSSGGSTSTINTVVVGSRDTAETPFMYQIFDTTGSSTFTNMLGVKFRYRTAARSSNANIILSNCTFEAPPPAELTSYDVNNVQFTKTQLYGTEGTMTIHGDGTSESPYSVQIDGISFKAVSNPDYPDDTKPYFGAFNVNLPITYTYSGDTPVVFDTFVGATVASAYSSHLTITEVDTTNNIVYFKLNKNPSTLDSQKYIRVSMKASSNNYTSNFQVYFTNATIAT